MSDAGAPVPDILEPANSSLFMIMKTASLRPPKPLPGMSLSPAEIGWDAWFRTIDLVTPRRLKGRELLMRTRGWWTLEPSEVVETVEAHGKLVVGEGGELMVECPDQDAVETLASGLQERFGDQVMLAP